MPLLVVIKFLDILYKLTFFSVKITVDKIEVWSTCNYKEYNENKSIDAEIHCKTHQIRTYIDAEIRA